jgi:hypothetical protein
VSVAVGDEAFATRGRIVEFAARLSVGGETPDTPGADPVRVGGEPVATTFRVNRTVTAESAAREPAVVTATPAATPAPPDTQTVPRTDADRATTSTSSGAGPGFGVTVALLALCLVSVLRGRTTDS